MRVGQIAACQQPNVIEAEIFGRDQLLEHRKIFRMTGKPHLRKIFAAGKRDIRGLRHLKDSGVTAKFGDEAFAGGIRHAAIGGDHQDIVAPEAQALLTHEIDLREYHQRDDGQADGDGELQDHQHRPQPR